MNGTIPAYSAGEMDTKSRAQPSELHVHYFLRAYMQLYAMHAACLDYGMMSLLLMASRPILQQPYP
jgi:hypothetical protein